MTMIWVLVALFALARGTLLPFLPTPARGTPVRICIPESLSRYCVQMEEDLPRIFKCVVAPDMLGCLKLVNKGYAEITNVGSSGLYLGGKFYDLRPITTELINGDPFKYQAIALVRKTSGIRVASDLQNRTSCHTGMRRTVGWEIPVGRLYSSRLMKADCKRGDMAAVADFFGGSCVPGVWSSDPLVDKKLKSTYSKLCSRCKDPVACAKDDAYAGYEGTMNCLSDGAADVAFTKMSALREYLVKHPEFAEKAELLCLEGGRKSLLDPEPCIWGTRPSNAFVAKAVNAEDTYRLVAILLWTYNQYSKYEQIPVWFYKTLLSHPEVSGMKETENNRNTYYNYLGDYAYTIAKQRHGCEGVKESEATFCVTSAEEKAKCEDYAKAAEAKSLWPDVRCVKTISKAACMLILQQDFARLLVLDAGDVYRAGKEFGLQPIASELYNSSDAAYYAVAVLRSASDVTKLADLKGLRSCHTGMGRAAGWVMPVGVLATEGLLPSDGTCNSAEAMADFFSAGSCVPGANDAKSNPGRIRSKDLCKHCVGDIRGQNKCARDFKERYSGYTGALRCLAESRGDVAFVKHTTVPDYTDGNGKLRWTKDLLSSDFMLLCAVGGTNSVFRGTECNLGKVPSHKVVTSSEISPTARMNLAKLLADTSKMFSGGSSLFRLFRQGQKHSDLLFKDSATALKIIPFGDTYEQVLGSRFLQAVKRMDRQACSS